jgi:hypothetical protein
VGGTTEQDGTNEQIKGKDGPACHLFKVVDHVGNDAISGGSDRGTYCELPITKVRSFGSSEVRNLEIRKFGIR